MKVGILGAGQLGRMLALAGYPLGCSFAFYDPSPNCCAFALGEAFCAPYDDFEALRKFASGVDVVTYEFENVALEATQVISEECPIYPSSESLRISQNRVCEKELFNSLKIPTPRYHVINSPDEVEDALRDVGMPCVCKTTRLGYDGKGQVVVRSEKDVAQVKELASQSELIAEQFIKFTREVSIIGVRGIDGAVAFYPLTENFHHQGILRLSVAPAPNSGGRLEEEARSYVSQIMTKLNHVGVLTLELFETENGLVANEIAPRVHNSGHWTIDGTYCSQFENHIRAVCGYSLGRPDARGTYAMVNIIGSYGDLEKLYELQNVHVHSYAKEEREGRKIGHINFDFDSIEHLSSTLRQLSFYLPANTPYLNK